MRFVDIRTGLEEYEEGTSVNVVINIENDGDDGIFSCKIFDFETGTLLQGFGTFLLAGEAHEYVRSIGAMPDKDWHLRFTVTP